MAAQSVQFNEIGFLPFGEPITLSIGEFEEYFVDNFPKSTTRKRLFEHWMDYIFDFQQEVYPYFEQWIDGSFISEKLNPADLDFVTLLDGQVFDRRNNSKTLEKFWSFSLQKEGLDAYLCPIYEENHPNNRQTLIFLERFRNLYSNSKPDFNEHSFQKGFIQIIFER
jgi:hypothetical protein